METKKKLGRPLKENGQLSHDIKVRVDLELFTQLEDYCHNHQIDRATAIRNAIRCFLKGTE